MNNELTIEVKPKDKICILNCGGGREQFVNRLLLNLPGKVWLWYTGYQGYRNFENKELITIHSHLDPDDKDLLDDNFINSLTEEEIKFDTLVIDTFVSYNAKLETNKFLSVINTNKYLKNKTVIVLIQRPLNYQKPMPTIDDYPYYQENIKKNFNKIYSLYRNGNRSHNTPMVLFDLKQNQAIAKWEEDLNAATPVVDMLDFYKYALMLKRDQAFIDKVNQTFHDDIDWQAETPIINIKLKRYLDNKDLNIQKQFKLLVLDYIKMMLLGK